MQFNPKENYNQSRENIGYVSRIDARQEDYDRIGFMSGLEVHQQLLTKEKLFCHCPAGIFHGSEDYDAELVRHMRPTLSELGEYDGTALMEFRTRKEIIYRINNENACTYEVDDTPPFPINREALGIALEISLLSKLNVVGEVHITRKQYLDGSIPTGFQRTAILGVEGELELPKKNVRLIQLSIEEDSCREISDIGHTRLYKTDRLGMPLIETVTYPDFVNPDEVKEGCDYIRFLNRSTGKVRTGMGAGRQDVNVSCRGGSRVEIKGVAHTKWIPELTHNECFRQWALLQIKAKLLECVQDTANWKMTHVELNEFKGIEAEKIVLVNLPGFKGILSHFTQPEQMFADEISGRLSVIACLEQPFMRHSETIESDMLEADWIAIREKLHAREDDAQLLIWTKEDDLKTALETIDERCQMAFEGVPNETRKSLADGTTIFERVLPGADRMYPDTDSAPIPLEDDYINSLSENLPVDVIDNYKTMKAWGIAEECYTYIFSKNLFPILSRTITDLNLDPKYIGKFFGQRLKFAEGQYKKGEEFNFKMVYALFAYLVKNGIHIQLAEKMLPELIMHPKMDFASILETINFKKISKEDILLRISILKDKFAEGKNEFDKKDQRNWIMGQLRYTALGNLDLTELSKEI